MNDALKLVFNELRIYPVTELRGTAVTDKKVTAVMTINENLKSLGFTLKPKDILKLAICSESKDNKIYNEISSIVDIVKAKPMYPDFPKQVMEMDIAQLRMHQLMHYFSTYGLESIFGTRIDKGWLPDIEDTEKTEDDESLLSCKVIELVNRKDMAKYCITKLLSKNERLTIPERNIVNFFWSEYISKTNVNDMVEIKFKENLMDVFYETLISDKLHRDVKKQIMTKICQHSGDVLKCVDYCLTRCRYHFKTSQKRLMVQVLESYPLVDVVTNVWLSNKKADRSKLLVKFLDYNEYARNDQIKSAIHQLRNNGLGSYMSRVDYLLDKFDEDPTWKSELLRYVSTQPGNMLRMVARLLRCGLTSGDIITKLIPKVDKLSIQTLVTLCTCFGSVNGDMRYQGLIVTERDPEEKEQLYDIFYTLLQLRLQFLNTPFKNKLVYLDCKNELDLENSTIECNTKSEEGGYMRSGLAYKIPVEGDFIRLFTYWNDKNDRIDIDIHAALIIKDDDGKERVVHVGYDGNYLAGEQKYAFSGDITHSNAAEYIDIKLDSDISKVTLNIDSFTGQTFKNIEEVLVGVMVVKNFKENVKLYNSKNCIFSHDLNSNNTSLIYGVLDLESRSIKFVGKPTNNTYETGYQKYYSKFNLETFLKILMDAQHATIVNFEDVADYTITAGKSENEKAISLIDENFFMGY